MSLKTPVGGLEESPDALSANTALASESYVERALPGVLSTRDMTLLFIIILFFITNVGNAAAGGPAGIALWVIGAVLFFIPCGIALLLDTPDVRRVHELLCRLCSLGSWSLADPGNRRTGRQSSPRAKRQVADGSLVTGRGLAGGHHLFLLGRHSATAHDPEHGQHNRPAHPPRHRVGVCLRPGVVAPQAAIRHRLHPGGKLEPFHNGEFAALRRDYARLSRRESPSEHGG